MLLPSLVIGAALGFWLLLVANLAQMPWRSNPQFGVLQSSQTVLSYVRFSGLLVLLSPIISALPIAILGLLLPITCAWRWFESKSRRVVFLCVLATLGCLWFGLQIYPLPAGLALTVVAAAFLVISFLYFDLLTTIATISAWSATSNLVNLGVNTSFGMTTVVLCSLGFGVFLLLELYFSFQGQRYSEVEVRPLYAEHLAQRQALQAEVSAAREAQLRLAPQALPQVEGLSPLPAAHLVPWEVISTTSSGLEITGWAFSWRRAAMEACPPLFRLHLPKGSCCRWPITEHRLTK